MIKVNKQLVQWELNRTISISSDEPYNEVHFYNSKCQKALVVKPFDDDTKANIPNILLQESESIIVWLVYSDENGDRSLDCDTLVISPRKKPADYVYEETEVITFKKLTKDVEDAVKRADTISADLEEKRDSGYFNGKDGADGKDGYTPQRGIDYFTSDDVKFAVKLADTYIESKLEPVQERIDDIEEAFSAEKVNCVAGLKGFYYKAVNKDAKIIYLTKERLSTDGNYSFEVRKNLLDLTGAKGGTNSGITVEVLDDGSYSYKGTVKKTTVDVFLLGDKNSTTPLFTLPPGEYHLSDVTLMSYDGTIRAWRAPGKYTFKSNFVVTGVKVVNPGDIGCEVGASVDTIRYPMLVCGTEAVDWEPAILIEEDLGYTESAVGELLSVKNGKEYENILTITKVEGGKIYYDVIDEDPFENVVEVNELSYDDFSVWCHDCRDEGLAQLCSGATAIILKSSTKGSNKRFEITIDDSGTLSAAEIV